MSIRMLARELYQALGEVQRLERELETAPVDKRMAIELALRRARAHHERLRRALEGKKNSGPI